LSLNHAGHGGLFSSSSLSLPAALAADSAIDIDFDDCDDGNEDFADEDIDSKVYNST